jgi:hypothetical protein
VAEKHWCGVLTGGLGLLAFSTHLSAADVNLGKAKETTKALSQKNASTLIGVSTAVPEELRSRVIEILQNLELSRDRILLSLDRIEEGIFPAEEGVRRAVAIANAAAQVEKDVLQGLVERVPPPVVPKIEEALAVSKESWKGIVSAFQFSQQEREPDLPSRPSMDLLLLPGPFGSPPPDQ